jgi:hypothetical protein
MLELKKDILAIPLNMEVISDCKSSVIVNWRYRVNDKDYAKSELPAKSHALSWRYKLTGVTYEAIRAANSSSAQAIRAINWRYQIHPSDLN